MKNNIKKARCRVSNFNRNTPSALIGLLEKVWKQASSPSSLSNFLFVFFIFYLLFFILARASIAQQISLGISPPLIELIIKPGKSVLIAYKLENFSDPTIISATVLPFEAKDSLGNIKIKDEFDGPVRFTLDNSEIKLGDSFFLKTRESQQLLLRIRIPEDAPEGDYYYTLLSQTQAPPIKDGQTSNRVEATIGSNILITVTNSGRLDINGKISLFDVLNQFKLKLFGRQLNFFESSDKIPVVLIVENNGKNVIKPEGEIVLWGNFGEKASYAILPDNILAGSKRLLSASSSAEIDRPVTLLLSGFFIGQYKLSTTVNFGEGTPNLFASTSFIAIPLKLIIGILIAVVVGIFVIKKTRKLDQE